MMRLSGSLPSPGAWIETAVENLKVRVGFGRSLHRERGLKLLREIHPRCGDVAPFTGSVD